MADRSSNSPPGAGDPREFTTTHRSIVLEAGQNDSPAASEADEALTWYRRAGEGGLSSAQARLGDMLSDGFSTTPDYLEACQWLTLAAAGGDKLSEIRLRRVKSRLAGDQLQEAAQQAADLSLRLEKRKQEQERQR